MATHEQIVEALGNEYPGAEWRFSGESYANLMWDDINITKPTQAEFNAIVAAYLSSAVYIDKQREDAYLQAWPVAQQFEALQDAINGDNAKLTQMNADFEAIRQQYPK